MAGFPENVIDAIQPRFVALMPDYEVVRRPVRVNDPARTIGLFVTDWKPAVQSTQQVHEIGGTETVLATYSYVAQLLVKHTDEQAGRAIYGVDAKTLRAILYRDATLQVSLGDLTETVLGVTERFQRFRVANTKYMNNEISGTFVYLATSFLSVETQIA
jgi:hypothetical protein